MRFDSVDPKVRTPIYGPSTQWGGALNKQAQKIREADFKKKVKPCARLDRTLVYMRNNAFESLNHND